MSVTHVYGGPYTLSGVTTLFDYASFAFTSPVINATPLIGVRVTNRSTTEDITVYVDGVHYPGDSSGVTPADAAADPQTWGQVVPPGATVQYWASGGGSRPGSGLIERVTCVGTDDEIVSWSAIAR